MANFGIRLGRGTSVIVGRSIETEPQDVNNLRVDNPQLFTPSEDGTVSLCTRCKIPLLSRQAFDKLLEKGLVFTTSPEVLKLSAIEGCAMCKLWYSQLMFGRGGTYRFLLEQPKLQLWVRGHYVRSVTEHQLRFTVELYEGMAENFTIMSQKGIFSTLPSEPGLSSQQMIPLPNLLT